jgi:hypothetical protein
MGAESGSAILKQLLHLRKIQKTCWISFPFPHGKEQAGVKPRKRPQRRTSGSQVYWSHFKIAKYYQTNLF